MHRKRSNTKTQQNRSLYRLYFFAEGGLHIHGIEVVDTFFKGQSMSFCFNHLDDVKLPYFVKFLMGSFNNLFTELPKWFLLCHNEFINMLKYDVALVGDWHTKLYVELDPIICDLLLGVVLT